MNKIDNLETELLKSADELMAMGGDSRILLSERSGLNRYGCSPFPQYTISYSSCTSNNVSVSAYGYVESYLHKIRTIYSERKETSFLVDEFESIRKELRKFYSLKDDVDIILGSSGTDLELIVLSMALHYNNSVHNIIVGANEVGSGISNAAKGHFFSELTPLGEQCESGTTIQGFEKANIKIIEIDVRNENGVIIPEEELKEKLITEIRCAISQNSRALLHAVHRTKTGLLAPSYSIVREITQLFGDQIDIVTDACQGRLSADLLNSYLSLGTSVLVTGSKFLSGPPFSGALLVPSNLSARRSMVGCTTEGLTSFFSRAEFPKKWREQNGQLKDIYNIGLLLRWKAACYEMSKISKIQEEQVDYIIHSFLRHARDMINYSGFLKEDLIYETPDEEEFYDSPFDINSIITFTIDIDDRIFDYNDGKIIHKALYTDLMSIINNIPDRILSVIVQLGQPVKVRKEGNCWVASLRLALSANLICELRSLDKESIDMRFIADFETIKSKLKAILSNFALIKENSKKINLSSQ